MSDEEYQLEGSVKKLGKLVPILKNAHGNIIDGFHRQKLDPKWAEDFSIKLDHIHDPIQLLLARMNVNVCRRHVPAEEKTEWLRQLVTMTGWTPKQIAENSGLDYKWVLTYIPEEYKRDYQAPEKVRASDITQEGVKNIHASMQTEPTFRRADKPRTFLETPLVCSNCGMGTQLYPENFTEVNGKTYCLKCAEKMEPKPKEPKEAVEKAEALKKIMMEGPPDKSEAPEDEPATIRCRECGELLQLVHNKTGFHSLVTLKKEVK